MTRTGRGADTGPETGAETAPVSNAGAGVPALSCAPWAGLPRAESRDALTRAALRRREGAPLTVLAQEAFGPEAVTGGANYQLARRHYRNHGDLFRIARRSGYLWVEPTPELCQRALLDTANKHTVGNAEGGGVAVSNAEAMLECRRTLNEREEKGDLVGAFSAKRSATENRWHVLQDTFTPENYRLVPFSTRFNSVERVREIRDRYREAFRVAADKHTEGVVLTLTTDPSRYDSLAEMCEGLLDDVNALKDWVAYDLESGPSRAGHRPPSVVSVEFTGDGKPHVHVVFFGVRWVAEHSALSRYWSESRDRGEIVWTDRIRTQSGRWVWVSGPDDRQHGDTGGASPRGYLSESVDILAASADTSASEVAETAAALRAASDDGDDGNPSSEPGERAESLFKSALYWGSGLPAVTISPALKPDDGGEPAAGRVAPDGTILPDDAPSRWRYIGAAEYGELPGHIRENATVETRGGRAIRGRPPP